MPYIKQEIREEVDNSINDIIEYIQLWKKDNPLASPDGVLNYIITRLVVEGFLDDDKKLSYSCVSNMIKTFECAKLEVYRRLIGPYEDKKIVENDDVSCFM